jgi:hypothetical protein
MDLLGIFVEFLLSPRDHVPNSDPGPAVVVVQCSKHWMHVETDETELHTVNL